MKIHRFEEYKIPDHFLFLFFTLIYLLTVFLLIPNYLIFLFLGRVLEGRCNGEGLTLSVTPPFRSGFSGMDFSLIQHCIN